MNEYVGVGNWTTSTDNTEGQYAFVKRSSQAPICYRQKKYNVHFTVQKIQIELNL